MDLQPPGENAYLSWVMQPALFVTAALGDEDEPSEWTGLTHRHNIHPDQDWDRVVGWNPLLDSQRPAVLHAGRFRAFVDAEGALEPHSELPVKTPWSCAP